MAVARHINILFTGITVEQGTVTAPVRPLSFSSLLRAASASRAAFCSTVSGARYRYPLLNTVLALLSTAPAAGHHSALAIDFAAGNAGGRRNRADTSSRQAAERKTDNLGNTVGPR
jgi:hypothetical protein